MSCCAGCSAPRLDPAALTFDFRPLWQLDAATAATVALQKAQATQIYAGLGFWPAADTARLVEAQLAEDGTYPNAAATFAEASAAKRATATLDFDPDQPRDPDGRWTTGGAIQVGQPGTNPVDFEHTRADPAPTILGHPVPQTIAYPEGWQACDEKCLEQTENTRGADRFALYRRCVRECMGGENADC